MSSQHIALFGSTLRHDRTAARDPLQIPVALDFGEERFLPRPAELLRSLALWLATFAVVAGGALLIGNMPELNAAVPGQVHEISVIAEPAATAGEVREWYLPDVLFNDKPAVAEPIDTF
jgi:hypothetical protein